MSYVWTNPLRNAEEPPSLVTPAIKALRLGNTLFDAMFYDIANFAANSFFRGVTVTADPAAPATPAQLNLNALADPEGTILIINAAATPYVTARYDDVKTFIAACKAKSPPAKNLSITGVGSSALGSAAFAWNISQALGEPVAAIVPGYGVADVLAQGLGGWNFGLQTWLKQTLQAILATNAPQAARIGRQLLATSPGHKTENGAPVFERGSGSSDILHAILKTVKNFERIFGHSKGALVIENAVLDLPEAATQSLDIITFGCPISKTTTARYRQILGCFDLLGLLNAWGNKPNLVIPTQHTTNTWLPQNIPVTWLAYLLER